MPSGFLRGLVESIGSFVELSLFFFKAVPGEAFADPLAFSEGLG